MVRVRLFLCLALAVVILGGSFAQDKGGKIRGQLPSGWGRLGLSDDQKQKIYSIQGNYRGRIQELQQKLDELRKQQLAEMEGVLTDTQKKQLRDTLLKRAPGDAAPKDKSSTSKDKK